MISRGGLLVLVAGLSFSSCTVSTSTCSHSYTMLNQEVYHIRNDQYPQKYEENTTCKWDIHSKPNTKIMLSCRPFDIPYSINCTADRLVISIEGDDSLTKSVHFCGNESVNALSHSNRIVVGFFSPPGTDGGKFACTLKVLDTTVKKLRAANCDCGWRLSSNNTNTESRLRIVGGSETIPHEFPAMAGVVNLEQSEVYCGAVIIAPYYLLTAGHCVYNRDPTFVAVIVGAHNINSLDDQAVVHRVNAYEINPGFDPNTQINDIAIIQTATTIVFNLYVGPACLPFKYANLRFVGEQVIVPGWGSLEFSGALSPVLHDVSLQVISNNECAQREQSQILSSQMCTYTEGKDTCQGDSGGPLFWQSSSSNRLILVGIVSYGNGCADAYPGISTYVSSFVSWILQRLPDAQFCVI